MLLSFSMRDLNQSVGGRGLDLRVRNNFYVDGLYRVLKGCLRCLYAKKMSKSLVGHGKKSLPHGKESNGMDLV